MNTEKRSEYLTRVHLLKLLSDAEIASVSTAETAPRLSDGDEYLDLEELGLGVQRAVGLSPRTGGVLPRKAVREATWSAILARLPVAKEAKQAKGGQPS
jgi:hypothetical protein